jgi:hypothetical protein
MQVGCRVVGDPAEDVSEPGAWINVIQLGRLCRPSNYAERARIPQK